MTTARVYQRAQHTDLKNIQVLESKPPYDKDAPMTGVFASRSPVRPNPIALTTAQVLNVDHEQGTVDVGNIDAFDGTPIVDLKAYFPVCDRVQAIKVPEWVAHWPEWLPEEGMGLAEGEGTRGWSIGSGWLTLLQGKSGSPRNVHEPIRACPVRDPFGTELLIVSPLASEES